jgi:hypothetical protein
VSELTSRFINEAMSVAGRGSARADSTLEQFGGNDKIRNVNGARSRTFSGEGAAMGSEHVPVWFITGC